MGTSRKSNGGIEENTLAILDSCGSKDSRDFNDDRLAFLEAVRTASIFSENRTTPTSKMFEAVFQILNDGSSLELTMASYQLLRELDEYFPRVYLSNSKRSKSASSIAPELAVDKEAWSPFVLGPGSVYSEREGSNGNLCLPRDSYGFSLLIQKIAEMLGDFKVSGTKWYSDMLLFQYLVSVLEGDFSPRSILYQETMNWALLRESLLNMLLGSRRISYKNLMKDCLSILSKISSHCSGFSLHDSENAKKASNAGGSVVLEIGLSELEKGTSIAMQKLLILTMELDMLKKQADIEGHTSRADCVRTPLVEIIVDELAYNEDLFSSFLLVFSEPRWKLEIILQYFWKYVTQPSIRTRRSNDSSEDATFGGVLRCFSNNTSTKSIVRKIGIEVVQLLLAHAFQAYLSLQHHIKDIGDCSKVISDNRLVQICKDMISAFSNIRRTDELMDIVPLGKEALFTAAIISSTKS